MFCLHLCKFYSLVFILQLVGQFIARAVTDQILSKNYIESYKGRVDCEYARYLIFFCFVVCLLFNDVITIFSDYKREFGG